MGGAVVNGAKDALKSAGNAVVNGAKKLWGSIFGKRSVALSEAEAAEEIYAFLDKFFLHPNSVEVGKRIVITGTAAAIAAAKAAAAACAANPVCAGVASTAITSTVPISL